MKYEFPVPSGQFLNEMGQGSLHPSAAEARIFLRQVIISQDKQFFIFPKEGF